MVQRGYRASKKVLLGPLKLFPHRFLAKYIRTVFQGRAFHWPLPRQLSSCLHAGAPTLPRQDAERKCSEPVPADRHWTGPGWRFRTGLRSSWRPPGSRRESNPHLLHRWDQRWQYPGRCLRQRCASRAHYGNLQDAALSRHRALARLPPGPGQQPASRGFNRARLRFAPL